MIIPGQRKTFTHMKNVLYFLKPIASPVPSTSAESPSGTNIPSNSAAKGVPAEYPEQLLDSYSSYLYIKTYI
jgi:hypothetical protein